MNKTVRLFDQSSKIHSFRSGVVGCEKREDGNYDVILAATAFFPSEGGQTCDTGVMDGMDVVSVTERNGVIYHTVNAPVNIGSEVECRIDFDARFRKMQHHTGEHIISGLIFKTYGYNNVGFHLSERDVTADFDGELDLDGIRKIEYLANKAVIECHPVRAYYPDEREIVKLQYRSKMNIGENVRIVDIEGVDRCACCAPHVENTGEIGIIKILDFIRYKGGVRIHLRCGFDALNDYNQRYDQIKSISMAISSKQEEVAWGVERLIEDNGKLKGEISSLKRELVQNKLDSLDYTHSSICLFDDSDDMLTLRNLVNGAVKKTDRICAVFSGTDTDGYKYIIASDHVDLKPVTQNINALISGRGGGSSVMIQGSCTASRKDILDVFQNHEIFR